MLNKTPSWINSFFSPTGQKKLFLILTLLGGLAALAPFHDYQLFLSQGDHGRDLYCFKLTMDGAVPYKDYSWLFGPLMPYYYSLFYKLFGVSIQSVLLGQNLLILLTGLFMYLTCAVFLSPALSCLCALWYWVLRDGEFFYTYNHSGGLLLLVMVLFFLFQYIKKKKIKFIWPAYTACFLFIFIRLNMGVSTLAALTLSLTATDLLHKDPQAKRKILIYFGLSLLVTILAAAIYELFIYGLPSYIIAQSFPYSRHYREDVDKNIWSTLVSLGTIFWTAVWTTWVSRAVGFITFFSGVRLIDTNYRRRLNTDTRSFLGPVFLSIGIFFLFSLHEFIFSGVYYRMDWVRPFFLILLFFILGFGTRKFSSFLVRFSLGAALTVLFLLNLSRVHTNINLAKKSPYYLNIGLNKIHASQPPDWFMVVTDAVRYIKKHVPKGEEIFAFPMDPLYYFLTERDSASRQLAVFERVNMVPEQEDKLIDDLERNRVRRIILSNRAISIEAGMGRFGETYGVRLKQYLDDNFKIEIQFGVWTDQPSWAWNHSVRILKRISWREEK